MWPKITTAPGHVVAITGTPVDMDPIMDLAKKHNLWVLEDAAQSLGATYKGRKIGTIGHVGSFSTITGKITNTGEGGFVITDDDDLFDKMWGYSDFARKRSLGKASKYHWGLPCTNYRITNMQAAIGLEQMKKADWLIAKRTENARYLTERLKGLPSPPVEPEGRARYFYYVIRLDARCSAPIAQLRCRAAAEASTISLYLHHPLDHPQHLEPVFRDQVGYGGKGCPFECKYYDGHVEYGPGLCPVAEEACEEVFWLASVHPLLDRSDLDDVADAVIKVATAFAEKTAAGIQFDYGTPELRARL
jgi:dTDP-4-amino-4,6-dideoxygalactose transaminase